MPQRVPKRDGPAVPCLIPAQSPTTPPDLARWAAEAAGRIRAELLAKRPLDENELTRLWEELARLTAAILPAKASVRCHYSPLDAILTSVEHRLHLHVLTLLDGLSLSTGTPATGAGKELIGEVARLVNTAAPPADPPPPPPRVRCDPADNSVYLDGKRIATGLTADQFQFVSAVAKAFPESISFEKIMQGKKQGKNPTRIKDAINNHVRGAMPATHLHFILAQARVGYRLNLPPASCHR